MAITSSATDTPGVPGPARPAATTSPTSTTTSSSAATVTAANTGSGPVAELIDIGDNTKDLGEIFPVTWKLSFTASDTPGHFVELKLFSIKGISNDINEPELFPTNLSFDMLLGNGGRVGFVTNLADSTSICGDATKIDNCLPNGGTINVTLPTTPPSGLGFFLGFRYSNGDFFYSKQFAINGTSLAGAAGEAGTDTLSSTSTATTTPTASISSSSTAISTSPASAVGINPVSSSGGLSTGAKVGIAIAAVGGVLIFIILALLLWRRAKKRQQQAYAYPGGPTHTPEDYAGGERDLHAEKELNTVSATSSPYETMDPHAGLANIPAVVHDARDQHGERGQRESWVSNGRHGSSAALQDRGLGARESYHDLEREVDSPTMPAAPTPPQTHGATYSPTAAGGVSHLREPGMSPQELARLEEEERRLDEAIAEAERRRA